MTIHALIPRLALIAAALALLLLVLPAPAQTDACRQLLMQRYDLRQLYARGNGMALRVSPVPEFFQDLTAGDVYEVARRQLQAQGLHDPDASQWLEINVNLDTVQFAILLSLRRWTDDLGYGLPGESTVWGLGGGGRHGGNAGRVLAKLVQHVDRFIELYVGAQQACAM